VKGDLVFVLETPVAQRPVGAAEAGSVPLSPVAETLPVIAARPEPVTAEK
jgi:hypothetical protein